MSDQRLRELKRRFRETETVQDEAAWLRMRVRTGEVRPAYLELAAQLGDPAAGAVRGLSALRLDRLLPLLSEDRQVRGRAALALATRALARTAEQGVRGPETPAWLFVGAWRPTARASVERVATALQRWLLAPDETGERAVRESAAPDSSSVDYGPMPEGLIKAFQARRRLASNLRACVSKKFEPGQLEEIFEGVCLALSIPNQVTIRKAQKTRNELAWSSSRGRQVGAPNELVRQACRAAALAEAENALTVELVPWLLGYGDPLRERGLPALAARFA